MLIRRSSILLYLLFSFYLSNGQSVQIQLADEYYQQGDFQKAKTIYDELAKDKRYVSRINANYLQVLIQIGEPKELEKHFEPPRLRRTVCYRR